MCPRFFRVRVSSFLPKRIYQRHSSVRSTPPLTPPSTDNNKRSSRGKRFRKFLNNNNIDDANIIDDTSSHGLKSTSLNRRKRGKACSRRLMGLVLFAGTGLCVFHVGWWAYWGSRCHEGCYEKSTAPTGTQGPEQVKGSERECDLLFSIRGSGVSHYRSRRG